MTLALAILFFAILAVCACKVALDAYAAMPATFTPLSCPACGRRDDEEIRPWVARSRYDEHRRPASWCERLGDGRRRCRMCRTTFREHPDGTLVQDRED